MKFETMFLMLVLGKENFSDNLSETEKSSHEVKVRCGISIFVILKVCLPSMKFDLLISEYVGSSFPL